VGLGVFGLFVRQREVGLLVGGLALVAFAEVLGRRLFFGSYRRVGV
jgi:hypothetical protein